MLLLSGMLLPRRPPAEADREAHPAVMELLLQAVMVLLLHRPAAMGHLLHQPAAMGHLLHRPAAMGHLLHRPAVMEHLCQGDNNL
jgi:hypothetical protein